MAYDEIKIPMNRAMDILAERPGETSCSWCTYEGESMAAGDFSNGFSIDHARQGIKEHHPKSNLFKDVCTAILREGRVMKLIIERFASGRDMCTKSLPIRTTIWSTEGSLLPPIQRSVG